MNAKFFAALQARLDSSHSGYNVSIEKLDETLPGKWVVTFSCRPQDPSGMLGKQTMVRLSLVEDRDGKPYETNGIIIGYRN